MNQMPHGEETAELKTATAMSFSHGSGLLFLKDSDHSFLVDSGATLSILLCSSSVAPSGPKLIGANGANIPPWVQKHTLAFSNRSFTHELLLSKVATPILGLDFLRKFQLSIHPLQAQVLDKDQRQLTLLYVCHGGSTDTDGKNDPSPKVRCFSQHGPSHTNRGGKEGLLQQHCRRLTGRQHTTAGGKQRHPGTSKMPSGKIPFHRQVINTPPHPHRVLNTTSTQVAIVLCSPDRGDWHQTSSKSPKQSSSSSKRQLSSGGQTPHGHHPCIWSPRRTALGGPAVTTAASTPLPPLTGPLP
jgi:hypothetical protein